MKRALILGTTLAAAVAAAFPASGSAAGIQPLQRSDIEAMRSQRVAFVSEDFELSMARFLPQLEFAACTEPVSSRSDDACFAPGDLAEGFSVHSSQGYGVLSMGRDLVGVSSMTIGGWPYRTTPSSINYTRVEFERGPTVVAADVFGFRLVGGSVSGVVAPVTVEAFDQAGQTLGSFEVTPPAHNQAAFVGFSSPVPLGAVEFGPREENVGVQIDNLLFGGMEQDPLLSSTRLTFGTQAVGAVGELSVQVHNPGDQPWLLDVPTLQGGAFALVEEDCSAAPLVAGAQCTIRLAFAPAWIDTFFGRVQVSGDFGGLPLQVDLHGIGSMQEATP